MAQHVCTKERELGAIEEQLKAIPDMQKNLQFIRRKLENGFFKKVEELEEKIDGFNERPKKDNGKYIERRKDFNWKFWFALFGLVLSNVGTISYVLIKLGEIGQSLKP